MEQKRTRQQIVINEKDFPQGIGGSSSVGIQLMQNIDNLNVDGTIQANFKTINTIPDPVTTTFTANAATNELTVASTFQFTREGTTYSALGRVVTVSSSGSLPAGLSAATNYYIIQVSANVIKLASTFALAVAGTEIDITTAGTGTLTITSVNPTRFEHYAVNTYNPGLESIGGGTVFAQDSSGRVWQYMMTYGWVLVAGNTVASGGYGLAIWKNYLFSFRPAFVDVYGPLSSNPTPDPTKWSNSWAGGINLSQSNAPDNRNLHTAFVAQNNILYFANAAGSVPWVGSLLEVPGQTFAPGTGGTYTWSGFALDLPNGNFITDFDELGSNLMIGTISNFIYPWDTFADSFDLPIIAAEPNVNCLKTANNILYYGAGFRGNIYKTLGTTSELVNDYSDQLSNVPETMMSIVDMQVYKGYILFTATGNTPGLYILDIATKNRYSLFNTCSTSTGIPGAIFTDFDPFISNLNYICYRYFFSWSSTIGDTPGSTRGCDSNFFTVNGPWRATGDISNFTSRIYRIGEAQLPYTFDVCELYLTEPIPATHSVIIQYRTNNSTAFSSAAQTTFDATALDSGGGISGFLPINVENAKMFQAKIIISIPVNVSGTSQYTTPKIREIKFK